MTAPHEQHPHVFMEYQTPQGGLVSFDAGPWAHFPQKGQTVQFPDPHPHAPDTTADMTAELEYEGVVSDITWTYRQRTPRTPPAFWAILRLSNVRKIPTSSPDETHDHSDQPDPTQPGNHDWKLVQENYGYSVLAGQYRIADMAGLPQDLPNGRIMAASHQTLTALENLLQLMAELDATTRSDDHHNEEFFHQVHDAHLAIARARGQDQPNQPQ